MINRVARKRLKKIQKEIDRLRADYSKVELRPCLSDAELKEKDADLISLLDKIYELEADKQEHKRTRGGIKGNADYEW
jgi:hypothetical protein